MSQLETMTREVFQGRLDDVADKWNKGDMSGVLDIYADGALSIFVDGDVLRGKEAILEAYRRVFPDAAAMGTLERDVARVHMDTEKGRATAMVEWAVTMPDGKVSRGYSIERYDSKGGFFLTADLSVEF